MSDVIAGITFIQESDMSSVQIIVIGLIFIVAWRLPEIIKAIKER